MGVEINEAELAGRIEAVDAIGRAGYTAGLWAVAADGDLDGGDTLARELGDAAAAAAVDQAGRQMEQQIDQPGSGAMTGRRSQQPGQGSLEFRANSLEPARRSKKWIEKARSHGRPFMTGLDLPIQCFMRCRLSCPAAGATRSGPIA